MFCCLEQSDGRDRWEVTEELLRNQCRSPVFSSSARRHLSLGDRENLDKSTPQLRLSWRADCNATAEVHADGDRNDFQTRASDACRSGCRPVGVLARSAAVPLAGQTERPASDSGYCAASQKDAAFVIAWPAADEPDGRHLAVPHRRENDD